MRNSVWVLQRPQPRGDLCHCLGKRVPRRNARFGEALRDRFRNSIGRVWPDRPQVGCRPIPPVVGSLIASTVDCAEECFSRMVKRLLGQRSHGECQFALPEDISWAEPCERQQRRVLFTVSAKLSVVVCRIQERWLEQLHQGWIEPRRPKEPFPCRACFHLGVFPLEEWKQESDRPFAVHSEQRNRVSCQQHAAMPELGNPRVTELGKHAPWFVSQTSLVLKVASIPPVKQPLRHMSHGMVDRTADEIVVLLFDLVVEPGLLTRRFEALDLRVIGLI